MSGTWIKDPDAVLDYTVDWSAWLESGDTIEVGEDYTVRFRVTTVGIRTDDRTITLLVRQR
jgi:hypothetical protein